MKKRLLIIIPCVVLLIAAGVCGVMWFLNNDNINPSGSTEMHEQFLSAMDEMCSSGDTLKEQGLSLQAESYYAFAGCSVSSLRYAVENVLWLKGEGDDLASFTADSPYTGWEKIASICYASPYPYYFEGLVFHVQAKNDEAKECYTNALLNPAYPEDGVNFYYLKEMSVDDLYELRDTLRAKENEIYEKFAPTLIEAERDPYTINTELWSKRFIYNFLQFASSKNHFLEDDQDDILAISLNSNHSDTVSSYIAGLIYSNVSNASSMYFDDKIVTPRGHGFAAEHANHLADIYMGRKATILGDNNAKNGADRNVNGVNIQTKYCRSGSACISECFDGGEFRYWNPDGSPMQIEVPSDMYDAAVKAMEHRIKNGEVSGVTDPVEAKNIIRKGHFTYAQARNIAKAGTVESILYDASSGAIIARNAFGITAVISFALSIWDGQELDVAIKNATIQGLKSGGIAFATAVLAGQLSKAGLNSLLVGSSEAIAKAIGPKASAALVNALRSGTNIYGAAAMKSLAKLLRNNGITAAVSFAVLSVGDVANIFRGRISGKQLFKNLTNTGASIAGGTGGWIGGAALGGKAGAAIGSFIAPGAGTAAGAAIGGVVGGIAGSFGGGALAGKASEKILDHFIEDDADKMVKMIQDVFTTLAGEYLINKKEAEDITTALQTILDGKLLREMFASKDQKQFARDLLLGLFEDASRNRQYVRLPSTEQFQNGLRMVLEDLADENTNES